jgi:glycosyltransferase involved in cell wall biosynthesis
MMPHPEFGTDYRLSIVIPVFNEEQCLQPLIKELTRVMEDLSCDYEILFVDDHSRDATPEIITEFCQKNPRVRGLRLSRNFGHQAALCAGLAQSRGDAVITMDGDLQHPPDLIPSMVRLWRQDGYEIVNTIRENSEGSGFFDRIGSKWFYRIFNRIADIQLTPGSADFRLMDQKCVQALSAMGEYFKFLRGQIPYIGFRQTFISFQCPPRFAGERSYTFRQSLRLASNGLLSFSTFGLKVPFLLGLLIMGIVGIYGVTSALLLFLGKVHLMEGWLSLALLLCLNIGLQLTFMGMIGLYIGKIFIEVKGRPLYFIEKTYHPKQSVDSLGYKGESRFKKGS